MKRNSILLLFILFFCGNLFAQDTIYVLKSGVVVFKQSVNELDSVTFINSFRKSISEIMSKDSRFSLFYKAYVETGYADIMNNAQIEDDSFEPDKDKRPLMYHTVLEERPKLRKFGFTVLATSDETLANYTECPVCPNGVNSLDDMEKMAKYYYSQVFSDGNDVTDRKDKRNYLNRYIAYHCLNKTLKLSRFIKDYDIPNQIKIYDMFEYIETMLDNTLMEVQIDRDYIASNTEFGLLNCMSDPSKAVLFTSYTKGGGLNGYYHEITKPIIYSKEFVTDISAKRLRLDAASFFPELATNDMRGNNPTAIPAIIGKTHAYLLPNEYLDGIISSENTRISYIGACEAYEEFQGDHLYFKYPYNFSIKTFPIPAGTYEIRLGYNPTGYRGIDQLYLDSVPCGDPIDFSNYPKQEIGYEIPGSNPNDPYGYKNDSLLRQQGFMKGPSSYYSYGHWYGFDANSARLSEKSLRKILGTYTFTETRKHTLGVVSQNTNLNYTYFMFDYIEFVPVEFLKTEGVD